MSHLLATPRGITLAGVILAKRNSDGSFAVKGHQKYIHAQLQAAYGKAVHPQAMRYVERGCELLAKVSDKELEEAAYPFHPNPHAKVTVGNDFSDLTKGLMMFALTGLNDMENVPEGKARLLKMQGSIHHDSLLKSYGLPTWEQLTKDDGDDEEDDEDDEEDEGDDSDDSDDSGTSAGGGNSRYNPDEPRIPAGQPGGGQWTTAGNGTSTDSGSISADDIRSIPTDDTTGSSKPTYSVVPISQTRGADNPAYVGSTNPQNVILDDGSILVDANGNYIQMPGAASLNANVAFGESIKDMRSIDEPFSYFPMDEADLEEPDYQTSKEDAMTNQFARNMPMDYQRVYPTPSGAPNPMYVDFGNYNFGAVAAAAGYSLPEALFAAARVNWSNIGNPNVDTSGALFSNSTNNAFITQGYNDYKAGKIKASK